jgi:hypothetical protein
MAVRIHGAQDFSRLLVNWRAFTDEERSERFAERLARLDELSLVRDPDKVAAREFMERSLQETDALGRRNPMRNAMLSGGATGRFMKRRTNAREIRDFEAWRSKQVARLIADHLELYRKLWSVLSMSKTASLLPDANRILDKSAWLKKDANSLFNVYHNPQGWQMAEQTFREQREAFAAIRIRPFRKNAAHVVRELERAMALCRTNGIDELLMLLRNIRRGTRWVFALDALQMEVIRPFSLLRHAIRRKRVRGADGTFVKGPRILRHGDAPQLFNQVETSLSTIRGKIEERCRDKDLARPIKKRVTLYLDTAQQALEQEEWMLAKRCLLQAARCM